MDADDSDPPFHTLRPANFAVLVGMLTCIVAIPAAYWLADSGLLPWAVELGWDQLRAEDQSAVPGHDQDSVELTRSGCFGRCPVYSVKLFASGHVEFEGEAYVCAHGRQVGSVDPRRARELIADIAAVGFFELRWKAGDPTADASRTTMTLRFHGRTRSLHDLFVEPNTPRLIGRIGSEIDAVAGTGQWLPIREGQSLACANGKPVHVA